MTLESKVFVRHRIDFWDGVFKHSLGRSLRNDSKTERAVQYENTQVGADRPKMDNGLPDVATPRRIVIRFHGSRRGFTRWDAVVHYNYPTLPQVSE